MTISYQQQEHYNRYDNDEALISVVTSSAPASPVNVNNNNNNSNSNSNSNSQDDNNVDVIFDNAYRIDNIDDKIINNTGNYCSWQYIRDEVW